MIVRVFLVLSLSILSACATGPSPVSPDEPAARSGSADRPTPAVTSGANSSVAPGADSTDAVSALLEEARQYREAGDITTSLARLERALRIAPENAEVYLELARSHMAAGNAERALASAERGMLYCEGWTCVGLRLHLDSEP